MAIGQSAQSVSVLDTASQKLVLRSSDRTKFFHTVLSRKNKNKLFILEAKKSVHRQWRTGPRRPNCIILSSCRHRRVLSRRFAVRDRNATCVVFSIFRIPTSNTIRNGGRWWAAFDVYHGIPLFCSQNYFLLIERLLQRHFSRPRSQIFGQGAQTPQIHEVSCKFWTKGAHFSAPLSQFTLNYNAANKVDMRKVNLQVIRPWIAKKVIELSGLEDELVVEYAMGLLEDEAQPVSHCLDICSCFDFWRRLRIQGKYRLISPDF